MTNRFVLVLGCLALFCGDLFAQDVDRPLRIIGFGAHPDDCELQSAGVGAMWAARGHAFKCVSMTNGDIGHFEMAGGPLAIRRTQEVEECARILGTEVEVLDIHDGELMPTLENRKTVARLIRNWQADVVMFHRPYDYHADHRYTGVLVHDASVLVTARFFTPDTPRLERNPILLYYADRFTSPVPFVPDIVVGIDEVADLKWQCLSAMPSQFADRYSWAAVTRPGIPDDDDERAAHILELLKQRSRDVADRYRDQLIQLYGEERGRAVEFAEAFQVSEYGRSASAEELMRLFPGFE